MSEQNTGPDDPSNLEEIDELARKQLARFAYICLVVSTRMVIGHGVDWASWPWGEIMEMMQDSIADDNKIMAWVTAMAEKYGAGAPGSAIPKIVTKLALTDMPEGEVQERAAPSIDAFSGTN